MTESTQLQTTENNNAGVVKMEPPPPTSSSTAAATTTTTSAAAAAAVVAAAAAAAAVAAASPAPSSIMDGSQLSTTHLHQQHQLQLLQQHQQQQQQYALKWNDFQSSILNSFRHLRDEEDFVDVTLACDQRSFTAHKVVLSACSPYFRKLLKANPCEHPIVILRDIRTDDVENLLSFMYNGEVNVSHDHLPEFLKTAHLLQVRGLADVSGSSGGGGGGGVSSGYAPNLSNFNTSKSQAISLSSNINNNSSNSSNSNKMSFPIASQIGGSHNNNISSSSITSGNGGSNNNSNTTNNNLLSPFTTPTLTAPVLPAALSGSLPSTANIGGGGGGGGGGGNGGNTNNSNNNNNNNSLSGSSSSNTPAIQELKASSVSPANHHWDLADADSNRNSHLTPPPQKRIKSADLFRAQHGISPERLLLEREFPVAGQHALTRERHRDRDRSRETSRDREREREREIRNLELRESLLGQALENSNGQQLSGNQKQHGDLTSLHAQSAGEDSNSSDTEPSDRGDVQHDGTMDSMNGSIDNQRSHSFPSAFLGLQGLPGLLPGPSGIGANDFVTRRSLEMRVRATDPRPCPKCGKIYRSAHTLRTHLEDKHTVCPGYRCVLCGTVAKSRNSLHSHMSRQHRGISTKDLPVLPMPSAFDPEMASRLLAKSGVKISPAELRARASPTSSGNGSSGQHKMDLGNTTGSGLADDAEDSDDDPEDLTTSSGGYGIGSAGGNNNGSGDLSRYHESLLSNFGHANTTISRIRNEAAAAAAAAAALGQQKDLVVGGQIPTSTAAGQSLLDTYLQFITENTFGMSMSQEHAAAAALHAAKMAQLNAMGHGLDKLPPGLLPPQFDLSKITAAAGGFGSSGIGSNVTSIGGSGLTIEPILRRDPTPSSVSPNENGPTSLQHSAAITPPTTVGVSSGSGASSSSVGGSGGGAVGVNAGSAAIANNITSIPNSTDIRRESSEPMDLGLDNNQSGSNNEGANSEAEENYSEDEGVHNT